eukprot:11944118-Ditylum_brightwellii.AAC.1
MYMTIKEVSWLNDAFEDYSLAGPQASLFFGDINAIDPDFSNLDKEEEEEDDNDKQTNFVYTPPTYEDEEDTNIWPICLAKNMAPEHLQKML